jgi:hypothetical protein
MKQLTMIFLAMVLTAGAQAATFQYIFNNVEQGEGGVANPTISVNGEKVKKNGVPVTTSPAPEPESPVPTMTAQGEEPSPSLEPPFRIRISASGARVTQSQGGSWAETGRDLRSLKDQGSGDAASLAFTVFPSRDIGLTGFWLSPEATGRGVFGAELEYTPVRVEVLGKADFLDVAALVGANTFGRDILNEAGTLHAGARVSVNFHPQLGITGAVRSNFTGRHDYRFTQAEVGLAYRF